MSRNLTSVFLLITLWTMAGCSEREPSGTTTSQPETITLATTTSTQDSGLLDMLIPMFREQSGIDVKVVAVGSGQALELGRRGDADVLLTHAQAAEEELVAEGFAEERIPVFHNDFVLVGPGDGPFSENPPASLDEALRQIASRDLPFVSRGDDSGTHRKEQQLWKSVSIEPKFSSYMNSGTGMAQTLRIAEEKRAYTLTDRGTWLVHRSELDLPVVIEGDPRLVNPYAVMVISPIKHPHTHAQAARQFVDFLRKSETQKAVGEFGQKQYGQPFFFPREK